MLRRDYTRYSGEDRHMDDIRELDKLKRENALLKKELDNCRKMISGYENVLKLNEKEIENAEEIMKMYENIVEFARNELILATETAKAQESASQLSRQELMNALSRIRELEEQNRKFKAQKLK
jgi:uncharacterized protein YgfB (UPF0149 family)